MLTVAEAARALGISPASVRVLLRRGVLPHHRPTPHRVVIAEADVAEHLARTRCEGDYHARPALRHVRLPARGGMG